MTALTKFMRQSRRVNVCDKALLCLFILVFAALNPALSRAADDPAPGKAHDPASHKALDPVSAKAGHPASPKAGEPSFPKADDPSFPKADDPSFPKADDPSFPKAGEPSFPKADDPSFPKADDPASASAPKQTEEGGIRWKPLIGNTLTFLTVSHAFRWAKEDYTREATMRGPYFPGVGAALTSLHGWGDGDEFLTNYVGHPMEGAVAGYIFSHNDPKYREEEFGKNRAYWRGKTRAFVYSAAYSVAFEIGPFSEITVGKVQAYWPQQGLVDWAVSPTIGLAWTLAEDALDKYVTKPFEGKVHNPALRALVRGWLSPSRSFANVLMFKLPWHRDSRPGITTFDTSVDNSYLASRHILDMPTDESDPYGRKRANFTFDIPFEVTRFGRLTCVGGGATTQFPLTNSWDALIHISGCKLIGLPQNYSGDSLTYMLGARWSPKNASRAVPHIRMMVGGHKIYQERLFPELRDKLLAEGVKGTYYHDVYLDYTQNWCENGLAVSIGAGVDVGINRALGFRLASLDYLHSWLSKVNGTDFRDGFRLSTGLIVNMGSW